jgi:hypothetical protein
MKRQGGLVIPFLKDFSLFRAHRLNRLNSADSSERMQVSKREFLGARKSHTSYIYVAASFRY